MYNATIFYPFISQWIVDYFYFLIIVHNTTMNMDVQYLFGTLTLILWGIYPEVELLDYMVNSKLNILRNCSIIFHSGCAILHSQYKIMKIPFPLHPHQYLLLSAFFFNSHLIGCRVGSHCDSDLYLLMINYVGHLYLSLLAICISSLRSFYSSHSLIF